VTRLSATVIHRRDEWADTLSSVRAGGGTVGLVPTMGALHGGHLSLIRRAAASCTAVAVTIYVNPLQFGPGEDLAAYPRDLDADVAVAAAAGATHVFAPTVEEMWPQRPVTTVHVGGPAVPLEGAARPGHFDGVATIVAKLFALSGPARAFFGEKDYQQLVVVRRLAAELSLPVEVVGCPTVRTPEGLALSSRNAYLSVEERAVAPRLYWSLLAGKRRVEDDGVEDPAEVVAAITSSLADEARFALDYAAVVDPETLETPSRLGGELRLLVAARLGRARLIDNVAAGSPHPPPASGVPADAEPAAPRSAPAQAGDPSCC
jgi:pantoate--beta-alanine ligase